MKVNIKGVLAEIIGNSSIEIDKIEDINSLEKLLSSNYPSLKNVSYTIIVNGVVVNKENIKLSENDSIIIIPLFEGG